MIYAIIFFAKLLEVAIMTVRLVLTTRGNRIAASLLSAVEITIWLVLASTVLLGLNEDPMLAVAFGAAFVVGIFVGMLIEDKLALGLSQIEIIADFEKAKQITVQLREKGYGVTTFDCEGREGKKLAVNIKIHRKDIPVTMRMLKEYENVFITVTEIKSLSRGIIERRMVMK
ncbi:MAG: DUF5698 domain-containing protein [Oscillospiraceae bacterium]|nr:DUF5698 domain-containing protein [Oscillospiraceae bacterium]